MKTIVLWLASVWLGSALGLVLHVEAAISYWVTNASDSGPGTLRQAILDATAGGGGTIRFSNVSVITLGGELPEIQANMVIEAEGTNRVVLDGNQRGRVLSIASNSTVELRGLRMTGGLVVTPPSEPITAGKGGGIFNGGDLTLINCSVDGNSVQSRFSTSSFGGGIYSAGRLSLISCAISNNWVFGGNTDWFRAGTGIGGGVYTRGTTLISNTVFARNWAEGGRATYTETSCCGQGGLARGGAIFCEGELVRVDSSTFMFNVAQGGGGVGGGGNGYGGGAVGTNLYFVNCTFSQNKAIGGFGDQPPPDYTYVPKDGLGNGGQIKADGFVELRACTVVNGEATVGAGIVANTIRIKNTIVAGNGAGSTGDVSGLVISMGHNLIEGLASPPTPTDIVGQTPMLSPLQDNGGPMLTYLPLPGSPAIDAGIGDGLTFDQRGLTRTKDILSFPNATGGDGTDIGAVELEDAVLVPWRTNFVTVIGDSGPGTLREAIVNANAARGGTISFSNLAGTIVLQSDLPILSPNVIVRGPGRGQVRIDANFHRGFVSGKRISGLTISRGAPAIGGNGRTEVVDCDLVGCQTAVESFGELLLAKSFIRDGANWGMPALHLFGKAVIERCVISNNFMSAQCKDAPGFDGHQGGAAILVESGAVTVVDSVFVKNTVQGSVGCGCFGGPGYGGAIHVVQGEIRLDGCSFQNNRALGESGRNSYGGPAGGAAVYIFDGNLRATNCTFSGNEAIGGDGGSAGGRVCPDGGGGLSFGGAIDCMSGDALIANCTFTSNRAVGGRGGLNTLAISPTSGGAGIGGAVYLSAWFYDTDLSIHPGGRMDLMNCTIVSNQALGGPFDGRYSAPAGEGLGGGVVFYYNTNNTIRNSIFYGNTRTMSLTPSNVIVSGSDGWGSMKSLGNNLFGVTNELTGFHANDLLNINPMLGPLRDNGGPVFTHALLAGSPAIDAGTNIGLAFDARGQPRTIDDPTVPNASDGDGTDIGAFEVNPVLTATETRRVGANVQVRFTTVSDKTYGVEYRPEVGEGPWMALPGIVTGTGGIVTYTDVNAAALPRRFYRIFERAR